MLRESWCYLSSKKYASILEILRIEYRSSLNGIVCVSTHTLIYLYIVLWPFKTCVKSLKGVDSVVYFLLPGFSWVI